jgi:uncharacterized protein
MDAAVHRFGRLLRLAGMRIAVSEVIDATRAAAGPGLLADRELLRTALAVCLLKDRRDTGTFDEVFDAFFRRCRCAGATRTAAMATPTTTCPTAARWNG